MTVPQRGEIVVERMTGNRAMVVRVVSPEEVTCRFADGRLQDRFTFELEPLLSPFGSLVWFFLSGFMSWWFWQGSRASLVVPSRSETGAVVVPVVHRDRKAKPKKEPAE